MWRFIVLFLLLFTVTSLSAQEESGFIAELRSPRWPLWQEAQERPGYRALWNGGGTWLATRILLRSGGEEILGLTEEQNARLAFLRKDNEIGREILIRKHQEGDPGLLAADAEAKAAIPQNDPYFYNATEKQKRDYVAANERYFLLLDGYKDQEVEGTLTPEQMEKVQALKLQLLPEMGIALPSMFSPLGLSEEQKAEMEAVKKELESEYEKLVDEAMALRTEYFASLAKNFTEAAEGKEFKDGSALNKAMMAAAMEAMKDETLRKKFKEHGERGKKFATRLKAGLMNILTDEQLDKMQKLIDEMPEFAKKMLERMHQAREMREKNDQWMPGPDSWRPGDGTPEEFKRNRKAGKAFPQEEKP